MQTNTFWLKFGSLSHSLSLKIRSRLPKPNQLFIVPHCYIHANLIEIRRLVHEVSCRHETVTLTLMLTRTQTGFVPKQFVPLPFCGDITINHSNKHTFILNIIQTDNKEKIHVAFKLFTCEILYLVQAHVYKYTAKMSQYLSHYSTLTRK